MITTRKIRLNDLELIVATIVNAAGSKVEILNLGATVKSLTVPDRHGIFRNVVLGYDQIERYFSNTHYYGSTIGRYANRISGSSFNLDGKIHRLENNEPPSTNHGGHSGFHSKIFDMETYHDDNKVTMRYFSHDGEGGFPGQVELAVNYKLTHDNHLIINYIATTDKPTPFNITNHSYFNLSGDRTMSATAAELKINGSSILQTSGDFIPTGRITDISETMFDFRKPADIAGRIGKIGSRPLMGYNDYYILNDNYSLAAELYDHRSGIMMRMCTDYPGLVFYTGDYLSPPCCGICLEGQLYVDAPNRPEFPSAILYPGKRYDHTIVYHFTTK